MSAESEVIEVDSREGVMPYLEFAGNHYPLRQQVAEVFNLSRKGKRAYSKNALSAGSTSTNTSRMISSLVTFSTTSSPLFLAEPNAAASSAFAPFL